jgi:16S rRNA (cytidine1402-2'-O)-methyltransferase
MGNLYIVATPIGNLQDITFRAIDTLKSVDYIACEDTRKTGNLINLSIGKENVKAKYLSYFEHNEKLRIPEIITLLKQDSSVALVSDSGTPLVSDPGYKLVRECIVNNINVISIPGATSTISALVSSGLPTDKFIFLGFLPKSGGKRNNLLVSLKNLLKEINSTVIIFESPFRLLKTMGELEKIFGDIDVVVCRELTKVFEEINRGKILEILDYYSKKKTKGEIVILFNLKNG